jgi:hypothetical protein
MSRVFTRALAVSTIGGLAVAPALAYAAGGAGGTQAHTPTVTTVLAPQHAQGGQNFLLSARVSPAAGPAAPVRDPEPERKGPAKGGKGKGAGHRRAAETGEITFTVDGRALAPVRISHGRALEKLELPPGNHTASASYGGDGHYSGSRSAPVTFAVG